MLFLKKFVLIGILISAPTFAENNASDAWAEKTGQQLFADCHDQSRRDWFKKYDAAQNDTINRIETLAAPSTGVHSAFTDWVRIVTPSLIPANYPFRQVYTSCAHQFSRVQNAETQKQFRKAVEKFDHCERADFDPAPPQLMTNFLTCLSDLHE